MATKYKYWWRPLVEKALREYPKLKKRKEELQTATITPNYNPMPGGSNVSQTTENLAMRDLPEDERKWLDAIESAICEISRNEDGDAVMRLVKSVYFQKTHTVNGAAIMCNMSDSTAKRRIGRFIWTVAKHKGLVER